MPPVRRTRLALVAAFLCVPALGVGCGGSDGAAEERTPRMSSAELAAMVLPRSQLGETADGLQLSDYAGPQDNRAAAEVSIIPKDTARDMRRAGRVNGYYLGYVLPSRRRNGPAVTEVNTTVELFRTAEEASRYLHDQADAYEILRGKTIRPGLVLVEALRTEAEHGDEARAFAATIRAGRVRAYGTIVAFREGRLVASVAIARLDAKDVAPEAAALASALERRIEGVLAETVRVAEPVRARRSWTDPRPLTLAAEDISGVSLELGHQDYVSGSDERVYMREFDVVAGRLGESTPFYVRTLTKSFASTRDARANVAYLRSRKGARATSRAFLRAFFASTDFRPRVLAARPLPWRGDTGGFAFTFDAPNGRIEGVMLGVARGQVVGGATFMGRADEITPDDLLTLRDRIRERLASAG